jgi:hypothetical protein
LFFRIILTVELYETFVLSQPAGKACGSLAGGIGYFAFLLVQAARQEIIIMMRILTFIFRRGEGRK